MTDATTTTRPTRTADADRSTSAPVAVEPNERRVRGVRRGRTVVDTTRSRFVWEHDAYPAWYVPTADVRGELVPTGATFESSRRGVGRRFDLVVDGETIPDAGWAHSDSPVEELRELVRLEWGAVDAWFEEDVEVFVHPRDPHVRVDVLPSSRHVRILVDDVVVADSQRPRILFETRLPPRFYLPKTDVRMDLLTPTDHATACPYKGWASYWSLTVSGTTHDDIAWSYPTPLPESAGIAGLVCFYDERVDVEVDGTVRPRPVTRFARA
jgi:uncharacterized protein (DUF427 family)